LIENRKHFALAKCNYNMRKSPFTRPKDEFHRVAISPAAVSFLSKMLPLEILRALALQVALKNDSEWER
jgi:hypothetical protein